MPVLPPTSIGDHCKMHKQQEMKALPGKMFTAYSTVGYSISLGGMCKIKAF